MPSKNSNNASRANSVTPARNTTQDGTAASSCHEHTNGRTTPNGTVAQGSNAVNGVTYTTNGNAAPNWNGPVQDSATVIDGDPFLTVTDDGNGGIKLSGRAMSFDPSGSGPSAASLLMHRSEEDREPTGPVIVSSTPVQNNTAKREKGKGRANLPVQQPIGTPGEHFSPSQPRPFFTTDVGPGVTPPGCHYIKIENVSVKDIDHGLKALHEKFDWTSKLRGSTIPPSTNNYVVVLLNFNDFRDAANAFGEIEMVNPSWEAHYITQTEYASSRKAGNLNGDQEPTSFHDGQVVFIATFDGLSDDFSLEGLSNNIAAIAAGFGEYSAIVEMKVDASYRQYRVEYYKVTVALRVIERLTAENPATFGEWTVVAQALPDYTLQARPKTSMQTCGTPHKIMEDGKAMFTSPTGRSAWYIDENGMEQPTPGVTRLPKCHSIPVGVSLTPHPTAYRYSDPPPVTPVNYYTGANTAPRSESWAGPSSYYGAMTAPPQPRHHRQTYHEFDMSGFPNVLHRERIASGQDVRTTVMLRNIPSDMTVDKLKRILDATSKGKYDFSYLRIDFSKNKNMGYAFVNFVDPLDILPLFDAQQGEYWFPYQRSVRFPDGSSPRRAEISYATVQGVDCAIEKFRNSAIMDEFAGFRPKLWWTHDTAPDPSMIGSERSFPTPNNQSKHQRSRDNATQIGLYAPQNRRAHMGGRQRRSQYDRGTTAQIHEDTMYNQMSPMQNGFGYGPNYILGGVQMPIAPPPPFPQMMPNMNGGYDPYGNPIYDGTTLVNPYAYGSIPFTDPFNGGRPVAPSVPPTPLRANSTGRRGRGPRVFTHPPRDEATARRQVAENRLITAAFDAGDHAMVEQLQLQFGQIQVNEAQSVPRQMNAEPNDAGNVVNYAAYGANCEASNSGQAANHHASNQ